MFKLSSNSLKFGSHQLFFTSDAIVGIVSAKGTCRLDTPSAKLLGIERMPVVDADTFQMVLRRVVAEIGLAMTKAAADGPVTLSVQ